ncbi:trypsin-like peptidase domain-containing protein [soil metagenome]
MLQDLAVKAAAIAEAVGPAVVRIRDGRREACGVVVAPTQVLTNAHNVRRDRVEVRFGDDRISEASLAGVDVDGDLALLRAETGDVVGVPFATGRPMLGQPVFAVGAARTGPRLSFGLVSAVGEAFRGPRGRRIAGSVEHTAPMAPGSSGSALVDVAGNLVGLNTNRVGNGFYQAIPADDVLRGRLDALAAGQTPTRPRLGIAIAPAWVARRMRAAVGLPPRDGLLVRELEPDGAAAQAGVDVGDLIVAAAGRPTADADVLMDVLDGSAGTVRLDLVRGEEERSVEVDLAA